MSNAYNAINEVMATIENTNTDITVLDELLTILVDSFMTGTLNYQECLDLASRYGVGMPADSLNMELISITGNAHILETVDNGV